MMAIISHRAVIKDAKSLVEGVSHQKCIHLKLMSKDEIEHSLKQTNARVYWNDLLAIRGTIHEQFVDLNLIDIKTRLLFLKKIGFPPCKAEQPLTKRHGVTRKRSTKRLNHTGNLFRKKLQLKDVC